MKKYFRIIVKGPIPQVFYDYEVPENAQLPQFWANVVACGYVLTERFMVPADQIASITVVTMDVAQQGWRPHVVN
jgi:hypothetical protein